jgi:dienelactone hydrolase
MTRVLLEDELLDAHLLRVIGSSPYGGADIGECLATAARIDETDPESWYAQWTATGDSVAALAEQEAGAGRRESARTAFLRASSYHRTAGLMAFGTPLDPRLAASNARQTELFRQAGELLDVPLEPLEIPYQTGSLPGYFLRAGSDSRPRATVILTGGYDGTCEELYFSNGAAALARGYNVLAFDGPGQGAALIQRGMVMRPDWEQVVGPVVDLALERPDVDRKRVALIGLSLGAHLAPRAASAELRLAACVADCGSFDLYHAFLDRLPGPLARGFAGGRGWARRAVMALLQRTLDQPTAGWALRRGMLVHGVDNLPDLVEAWRDYNLSGHAELIECPTWVCDAEGDDISRSAPTLVSRLTCPHEYVHFTAAEGAGDHCAQGARTLLHARCFGWLDRLLEPGRVSPARRTRRPAAAGGARTRAGRASSRPASGPADEDSAD